MVRWNSSNYYKIKRTKLRQGHDDNWVNWMNSFYDSLRLLRSHDQQRSTLCKNFKYSDLGTMKIWFTTFVKRNLAKGTVIGFHTYSTGLQQWLDKPIKKDFQTVQIIFTLCINFDQQPLITLLVLSLRIS